MQTKTDEAAQLVDDVEQAMLVFDEIQQAHSLYLQRKQLVDVGLWTDQRSKAMGVLQQALGAVWGCESLRADSRLGSSLQQRIGHIVEREQELAEKVKLCQDQLKSEMGKIRKGKKTIGSYATIGGARGTGLCFRNSL
ncbi:MAG: hypothetical protein PF495_03275 [Spirochaetales bacterium]|nr:hypothetical protein [Spirochaetales bacterium]